MISWIKNKLLPKLDHARITRAIGDAEKLTSGEIRVVVVDRKVDNPVERAQAEFVLLGMEKTAYRNSVLILLAPKSRNFAVIGDKGVHEKCGNIFWNDLAEAMTSHFKHGHFTEGLEHGISKAGALLAKHFPPDLDNPNELPDEIIERP